MKRILEVIKDKFLEFKIILNVDVMDKMFCIGELEDEEDDIDEFEDVFEKEGFEFVVFLSKKVEYDFEIVFILN